MIFLEYLRISGTENTAGGASTWPRGWRACPTPLGAPPASWAHGGSPPLIPAPTHFLFLPKNHHPSQARVLAHFATIFDLLAQSTSHKTALGDFSLVCDFLSQLLSLFLNQLRRREVFYFLVLRYARGKEIYERKRS